MSSSSSSPTSPTRDYPQGQGLSINWQSRLKEVCDAQNLRGPVFEMKSDRRGGRTAWSAEVQVGGATIAARYWYDGQYTNNAKEDAAEVALNALMGGSQPHLMQYGTTR